MLSVSCIAGFGVLNFEVTGPLLHHSSRTVGALDRATQVLKTGSSFDHEHLMGKQVLSMPWFGVNSALACLHLLVRVDHHVRDLLRVILIQL